MATELFLAVSAQGVLQQVVFGLATGGLYASLALALVLIYRAMETLNFAQGEMATFTTFIAFSLLVYLHLPYWLVFPATVVIAVLGGIAVERVIIRPVEQNAKTALRVAHRAYVLEVGEIAVSGSGADLAQNESVRRSYLGY